MITPQAPLQEGLTHSSMVLDFVAVASFRSYLLEPLSYVAPPPLRIENPGRVAFGSAYFECSRRLTMECRSFREHERLIVARLVDIYI